MLSLSTAPTVEPVTTAEAKTHCKVDHAQDDDYFANFLIPTARNYAETFTDRAFLTQTWILRLQGFGSGPIILPKPPLSSVTSVTYLDSAGVSQTWSTDFYDLEQPTGQHALHGSIHLEYGETYPSTRGVVDDVTITYVAGYGAAATAVPAAIKHAVLMLIEDLYRQRGSQILGTTQTPALMTAERLLWPFSAKRYDLRYD